MKTGIDNKRWLLTLAFATCLCASLSGCKREKAPQSAAEAPAAPTAAQSQAPQADVAAPSNDSVVADIYGNAKGGEYWFGRSFLLGDRRYHVGFAYSVPEQAQSASDQTDATEGRVLVSQITYALDGSQWQKLATSKDIGRFGMNDQAPVVEAGGSAVEFVENAERYLLAVPAWHTEMGGVEMHTAEIFAFDSSPRAWKYLGSVYTGENDDAGCTDEGKTVSGAACTASTGELKFSSNAQTGFPDISVIRSGATLGNDGKARTLGVADAIGYTYSASSGAYVQSQQ